ncbi:unnamed protein product, partial [Laminaria digitata]
AVPSKASDVCPNIMMRAAAAPPSEPSVLFSVQAALPPAEVGQGRGDDGDVVGATISAVVAEEKAEEGESDDLLSVASGLCPRSTEEGDGASSSGDSYLSLDIDESFRECD